MNEICAFHRPGRVVENTDEDDPSIRRLPELKVIFDRQIPWWPWAKHGWWRNLGDLGRARVGEAWILLVDGIPNAYGDRKFVMRMAHREAVRDENGNLPCWMRQTTRRERVKALRATQKHNDRRWHRKSNRKRRKAARMRLRRWVNSPQGARMIDSFLKLIFRDAIFPKILFREEPFEIRPPAEGST